MGRPRRVAPTKYQGYLRIITVSKHVGAYLRSPCPPLPYSREEKILFHKKCGKHFICMIFNKLTGLLKHKILIWFTNFDSGYFQVNQRSHS